MRKLFTAPKPWKSALLILLTSFIFSLLIVDDFEKIADVFITAVMVFAIPAYLSAIISLSYINSVNGKTYLRRTMLLSFISILIIGAVICTWFFIKNIVPVKFEYTILFGIAITVWLRHIVFISTAVSAHLKALPATLTQPVIMIAVLYFIIPLNYINVVYGIASILIFLCTAILFISAVNQPFKKNFGINGTTLLQQSLAQITEDDKKTAEELENFFSVFSVPAEIETNIIVFRTLHSKTIKTLFIVPTVHPGPYGTLCGSNLPVKLQSRLNNCGMIFVFHGAATHDFNPISTSECKKIADEINTFVDKIEYSDKCSLFCRAEDDVNIGAQVFGNDALFIYSPLKTPTDDIDFCVGKLASQIAMQTGDFKNAVFVDSHNLTKKGYGCVYGGSEIASSIFDTVKKVAADTSLKSLVNFKIGVASCKDFKPAQDGIGYDGIKVAVISTGLQKNAYILFDGNGMMDGLRDKIRTAVTEIVDECEVMTTDNHIVNIAMDSYNPVGLKISEQFIIKKTVELVKDAIHDLEDCEAGVHQAVLKDFKIFGAESTARLTSVINSTVSTLKQNAFITIAFGTVLSIIIGIFL
jgi:putative membrane protein